LRGNVHAVTMIPAMDNEAKYKQTLDYLFGFVDFSLQHTHQYSPASFDLGRMISFINLLGNPDRSYPIIHVAGTKGKGSVCTFCESALKANGYRVGLYTSPHLWDYTERIQIDGLAISHNDLAELVEEVKPLIDGIPQITMFEITTGLAFLYFARKKVDIAVIEVGLGGRLDATNICNPKITVITSISYDHTYLLGNTLAEIAGEKAGIIKPGIPLIISPQKDEAREVIERIAKAHNSPLIQVGKDYCYQSLEHTLDMQSFSIWPEPERVSESTQVQQRYLDTHTDLPDSFHLKGNIIENRTAKTLIIPLLGEHQVENAATAYAALQTLRQSGMPLQEEAIQHGFSEVNWPGRFEILQKEPPIIVDSAHNRDSAFRLREALDEYFPDRPVTLIFGASEDKDILGMFTELLPRVQLVILTKSFHPRAADPEILSKMVTKFNKPVIVMSSVPDAFSEAISLAKDRSVILVCGSLFITAEIRQAWQRRINHGK
jgi:dihydrofolate synthase/folylpolyglutamate synthase